MDDALSRWSDGHESDPPVGAGASLQKNWDHVRATTTADRLLENASDDLDRARLLASRSKEAGAVTHAPCVMFGSETG